LGKKPRSFSAGEENADFGITWPGNTQVPALASACAKADIVLSLVSLDPARGGDHLATWATDVVAMVTAGRATATRIRTVGEMIRLSGARLASVVVMDFDKADESLGASTEYLAASQYSGGMLPL